MNFFQILQSKEELKRCSAIVEDIGVKVADPNKVWDIANVSAAVRELGIRKDAKIIDLGAYNDSSLWSLHQMGYRNLYGIDVNKKIYDQPFCNSIRYLYGNIEDTHFPPEFFDEALCLSVLEHDVDIDRFFHEASRILKPNGRIIITVDFFPEKLVTHRSKWNIFSSAGLLEMIKTAKKHGFAPLFSEDELSIVPDAKYTPIQFLGFNYTFAFFCLVKNESEGSRRMPNRLSILSYSDQQGGISEYIKLLSERLRREAGIEVEIVSDSADANSETVLIEYAHGLERAKELPRDVSRLFEEKKKAIVEIHDSLIRFNREKRSELQRKATLVYRANEIANFDKVRNYILCPHISYTNVPIQPFRERNEICLGYFGFGIQAKRVQELVSLCKKLKVRAKFLVSVNEECGRAQFSEIERKLRNDDDDVLVIDQGAINKDPKEKSILVKTGFFTNEEITQELEACTHLVFAHRSFYSNSGSMTLAKRFSRPIIALDSFQAKQAQVIRARIFSSRLSQLKEGIVLLGAAVLNKTHLKPNFVSQEFSWSGLRNWLSTEASYVREKPPSLEFLEGCVGELSRDEDGFLYLYRTLENDALMQIPNLIVHSKKRENDIGIEL